MVKGIEREEAAEKTKNDEAEREILRLRGVVTQLRHGHLVHKGGKVRKIRADQSKLKRPVCFVNDLSYSYKTMDAYHEYDLSLLIYIPSEQRIRRTVIHHANSAV